MRGTLEDEEEAPRRPVRDTEVTLGTGMLVAIPLGLLLLCGVCFGLGYLVGHRGPATASQAATPTPAPDQEPLQANGAIPKPSAAEGAPVPVPPPSDTPATGADGGTAMTSAPANSASPAAAPVNAAPAPSAPSAPVQVRPAMSNSAPAAQAGAAPAVHAALPAATQSFMVQIAAVSNLEDANVLTNALRTRGYAVSDRREPGDGMIHVRIGPFSSREEANHWRDKLLGDGYNALVQP